VSKRLTAKAGPIAFDLTNDNLCSTGGYWRTAHGTLVVR
jgi:hypothetical protein